jgi:hypothetical protein
MTMCGPGTRELDGFQNWHFTNLYDRGQSRSRQVSKRHLVNKQTGPCGLGDHVRSLNSRPRVQKSNCRWVSELHASRTLKYSCLVNCLWWTRTGNKKETDSAVTMKYFHTTNIAANITMESLNGRANGTERNNIIERNNIERNVQVHSCLWDNCTPMLTPSHKTQKNC